MPEEKPKTLFLLLKVYCDNEYLDCRPNHAVIEVDLPFVDRVLGQIARVKRYKKEEDEHIWTFRSWNMDPIWFANFTGKWLKATHKDLLTDEKSTIDPADHDTPILLAAMPEYDENDDDNRTECECIIVRENEVKWEAIPKHCSDYVDTTSVEEGTWKAIRKLLGGKATVAKESKTAECDLCGKRVNKEDAVRRGNTYWHPECDKTIDRCQS